MRKARPFPLTKKGFSLVEVLVAMAIFSIFIAASVSLFTTSFEGIMESGGKSKNIYEDQKVLEENIDDETFDDYDEQGNFKIFFSNESGDSFTVEIDDVGFINEGSLTYIITNE
mgnify:CR=1 FL=1